MQRYNPNEIEPKWQAKWETDKIYQAADDSSLPKKYILEYFPYPSGAAMHVGHVRNYAIGDALSRYYRMSGFDVLHPMGWDGFGLPAENYAIKNKISPRKAIDDNTKRFREQLVQMGFGYDWSREIDSTDPAYYRWTQWLFLLLFRKGLAYQQESLQWWCPRDKTVLANEQVEAGLCWRCSTQVEKKSLKQWFFKITDYADRLDKDLDDVNWSDSIKSMQRNWIGKSKGVEITFQIAGYSNDLTVFTTRPDTLFGATFMVLAPEHPLVQTIVTQEQRGAVDVYIKQSQAKSDIERQETDREKTGVFTGAYAVNPVNDETIPIWIADYVLSGYGTGAIMAVPAHDERDHEFALKFDLPIRQVVSERFIHTENKHRPDSPVVPRYVVCIVVKHPTEDKILMSKPVGSDYWSSVMGGIDEGETPEVAARRELLEESGLRDIKSVKVYDTVFTSEFYAQHKGENRIAYVYTVTVELNSLDADEVSQDEASKQNLEWMPYEKAKKAWVGAAGAEILEQAQGVERPIVFEGRLINSGEFNGMTTSEARDVMSKWLTEQGTGVERTNYKIRDWLISRQRYWGAPIPIIHCPADGAVAVPEDQLPVKLPEIESYEPSGDGRSPLANVPEFVGVQCPTCGGPAERETDTMDGFACSSWYFLRFADPHNTDKAFDAEKVKHWLPVNDYIGGAEHAVMHLLYARFWTKVMQDEGLIEFGEPFTTLRNHGMILAPDGAKMSKSKGNTIEPGVLIDQGYGADAIRIMELFIGPWNQVANWSVEGMGGAHRFLARIWTMVQEFQESIASDKLTTTTNCDDALLRITHKTIKKVSQDFQNLSFNTAVAAQMEAVNVLYKIKAADSYSSEQWRFALESQLLLLAPFAPHIAEELWSQLHIDSKESIHVTSWPAYDAKYLVSDTTTIVVQVNGKLRAQLRLPADTTEEQATNAARSLANVAEYLASGTLVKTVYVPGKLVNFVVR